MRPLRLAPVALLAIAAACSAPVSPATPAGTAEPTRQATASPPPVATAGPPETPAPAPATPSPAAATASPGAAATPSAGPVELLVRSDAGLRFRFSPDELEVAAGEHVMLTFENLATVPHNLTFGAPIGTATSTVVEGGTSETIDFVAPPPGDYEFVCTIHTGMEGTLHVTE